MKLYDIYLSTGKILKWTDELFSSKTKNNIIIIKFSETKSNKMFCLSTYILFSFQLWCIAPCKISFSSQLPSGNHVPCDYKQPLLETLYANLWKKYPIWFSQYYRKWGGRRKAPHLIYDLNVEFLSIFENEPQDYRQYQHNISYCWYFHCRNMYMYKISDSWKEWTGNKKQTKNRF